MSLTRSEIVKALREEVGLSKRNAQAALSKILESITVALKNTSDVRIRNFGRFHAVETKERMVRQLQEIGLLTIPAKRVVRFRYSEKLKELINNADAASRLWPEELNQLYDNLLSSDKFQTVLDDHRKWLLSDGKMGARADFSSSDLRETDFESVDLRKARLTCACMSGSDLTNCNFENADLESTILEGTCLCWANLQGANLRCASLRGADLRWTDLQGADLSDADLSYANLLGADFRDAILTGAEFYAAKVERPQIEIQFLSISERLKKMLKTFTL